MTTAHKVEKAARLLAFATAVESWHQLDNPRSDLGSAIRLAQVHYQLATPTAAPLVIKEKSH